MAAIAMSQFIIDPADYQTIRFLGRGSCGEVYLCHDKFGNEVALKRLNPLTDPKQYQMFIREVIIPLQLNLPGIVHMIGFCFPDAPNPDCPKQSVSGAIIVTELMRNGCLMDVVNKYNQKQPTPGFGPTELNKSIFGIVATMAKIHQFGAIHRDLKPSNVFLDDNSEPRVADFGLARMITNAVNMTMTVGSPLFMAPELYADSEDESYTNKIDVYAFAVLLYQMFTKKIEMDDGLPTKSVPQMMTRIEKGVRLKQQPEIPLKFWNLIRRCWNHAPHERPGFDVIVREMMENDEFLLPGADKAKYFEYQRRITADVGGMNSRVIKGMRMDGIIVSQKEIQLNVSLLASTRGGIFQEEAERALTRSMIEPTSKRTSRYDFTRLKNKRSENVNC
jgi:serine/threonine protein kinase